jgi:cytochrome c-type biogenesis protein CcmF
MTYEIFLLVAAIFLVIVDVFFFSNSKKKNRISPILTLISLSFVIVTYLALLFAFLRNDFSLVEVYSYSSSNLSFWSKIYASWGGSRGSMLFLTLILSVLYSALRLRAYRKNNAFNVSASKIFSIILIVFVVVCIVRNPFESSVVSHPEGQGLNPQLQTFWMAIHPPIVFSAYALVLLAFSLVLAAMKTERNLGDLKEFNITISLSWLLLTLGIALGGIWAYEVLGWGGYWAWDPVETASLVPWLFLTAYFHAIKISEKKKSLTREFMILISFISLVFLSALTRGGFTKSVHSYAISPVGPIMLVFALGMIIYFISARKNAGKPLLKVYADKSSLSSRSLLLCFYALIGTALVCLLGLAFPGFQYNYWTFPFVLAFIIGLIGCNLNDKAPLARLFLVSVGALLAGLVVTLIGVQNLNVLASLGLPLLVVALASALYKSFQLIAKKQFRQVGKSLIHVGVPILLIGVLFSAGFKTTESFQNLQSGKTVQIEGFTITVSNFTLATTPQLVYFSDINTTISEHSTFTANILLTSPNAYYEGFLQADFYPNYGLVLRPLIINTLSGDLYIHLEYNDGLYNSLAGKIQGTSVNPQNVSITVQTSPLIYLIWIGVALLITGIALQIRLESRKMNIQRITLATSEAGSRQLQGLTLLTK